MSTTDETNPGHPTLTIVSLSRRSVLPDDYKSPPDGITVSIEDIREYEAFRARINRCPLGKITFTQDGKPLARDPEIGRSFTFMGLANIDYILMGFHEMTPEDLARDLADEQGD